MRIWALLVFLLGSIAFGDQSSESRFESCLRGDGQNACSAASSEKNIIKAIHELENLEKEISIQEAKLALLKQTRPLNVPFNFM
jgi:hypothetical protein